jgi:putative transposase
MSKRRIHPPEFKAQVALDALCSKSSLAEVAARYELHPVQVCQWKQQALKRLPDIFRHGESPGGLQAVENLNDQVDKLERANAVLVNELQWLKKKFLSSDQPILRSLLEPGHPGISLRRQCKLLGATRSSYYYHPVDPLRKSSQLVRFIDLLCGNNPAISGRCLLGQLQAHGFSICKNHLHRLLCRLGFAPFERNLTKVMRDHLVQAPSPFLKQEAFDREGEQWILDIAYWPTPRVDLFAALLVDATSRTCLAMGLSDRLSSDLVKDLLRVGMETHPLPFLLRSETWLPFLSSRCLNALKQAGISLVRPLWLDQLKGSGRATALAPLWSSLKQWAGTLRSTHSQASEEWILQQAIRQANGMVLSQEGYGKGLLPQGANRGGMCGDVINDRSMAVEQKCFKARSFLTPAWPLAPGALKGSTRLRTIG